MYQKKEDIIRETLERIPAEELIRFVAEKLNTREETGIPLSIFITNLSPLEAITRYLKEKQKKRINEIGRMLNKHPSAISTAYKNSKGKKFIIQKTEFYIPVSEFRDNPKLSIMEVVVSYLRKKNIRLVDIARILHRNPRTIWTMQKRSQKKE